MASATILGVLADVWRLIPPRHAPALVGGLAMATWKRPRMTHDVDFLITVAPAEVDQLIAQLVGAGLRLKPRKPGLPPLIQLGPVDLVQFLYSPPGTIFEYQVDLLIARAEFHRQALTRSVSKQVPGLPVSVQVVSCEDLILLKLLADRAIDHADARSILQANAADIDLPYLVRWARLLGVIEPLTKVWTEAFPDRPLPAEMRRPRK